jgi:hypothetical protein
VIDDLQKKPNKQGCMVVGPTLIIIFMNFKGKQYEKKILLPRSAMGKECK